MATAYSDREERDRGEEYETGAPLAMPDPVVDSSVRPIVFAAFRDTIS